MSDTVEAPSTADVKVGIEFTNAQNVIRPAKTPKITVNVAPLLSVCPGCGYDVTTELGTIEGAGAVVECNSCGTAWISGVPGTPAATIDAIAGTANLADDLKTIGATMKPGDGATIVAERRERSFEMLIALDAFAPGTRTLFSPGGIFGAARTAGFEIATITPTHVTIVKPETQN